MADMVNWVLYEDRLQAHGVTPRDRAKNYAVNNIDTLMPNSVAYMTAEVVLPNDEARYDQDFAFLKSDDYAIKYICTRPGERITCGALINWMEHQWIVTDMDVDDDIYMKGTITKCNYMLNFTLPDGTEVSKPSYIRDVTKYLVGENEKKMITVGDSRMSVTVAKDHDTDTITRGTRFLIDDPDTLQKVAYEVTKVDRVTGILDGSGIYKFLVCETNVRETDDTAEMVPDNSTYHPGDPEVTGRWL